jgi:thioredoxin
MIRSIFLLLTACSAVISAAAQNRYEEVIGFEVRQHKVLLSVTVQGVPHKFFLDVARNASAIFPEYAAKMGLQAGTSELEKVGIGQNLFIRKTAVARIDNDASKQPDVAGILGRDVFKGHVLTIDKKGKTITLSAPYKPAYMSLRSRTDMAPQRVDSLLNTGVVSLDFARNTMYFELYGTLAKTAKPALVKKESPAEEGAVTHLNREAFLRDIFNFRQNDKWKYQGNMPCVIDFWATWCGPCRKLDPVIKELVKEYEGRVKFYKVNVDEEKEIAEGYFNIQSIPLLLYIPVKGEPVKAVGLISKEGIRDWLDALLKKK